MGNLVYVLAAIGVVVLGTVVVAFWSRAPRGDNVGIKEFQREMKALSPEGNKENTDPQGVRIIERSPGQD